MAELEQVLYRKIKKVMSTWKEKDIYAVSFFVYANGAFWFQDYCNVSQFAISYNTESYCGGAGIHSERRWNYAFWPQEEAMIIEPDDDSKEMQMLFDWYQQNGIENIGEVADDWENGPVGYKELVDLVAKIARRFQDEGFLKKKFRRPIPIIIHDLEYSECTIKATEYANPNGEAAAFLHGNWETESTQQFPPIQETVAKFLNDPEMMARLQASSPGLSKEYLEEMLNKLRNM